MAGRDFRIAVIGDLHDLWEDFDLDQLNRSDYDLVLYVGDLGGSASSSLRITRSIARLERPALVMPGNADAPHAAQLAAELSHRRGLRALLADEDAPLGDARLCGYSTHRFDGTEFPFTVVAGRPYSMGGPSLAFGPELENRFGIASLQDSTKRLCELVDRARTEHLVFVAHNGPRGLGGEPTDIWGCDFKRDGGDWGDPDLAAAIEYARGAGRKVLAVVAGHMHLTLRGQRAERRWQLPDAETLCVNAARVPRILAREATTTHHHVALTLGAEGAHAEEIFVSRGA